jgi:hypothetical protein
MRRTSPFRIRVIAALCCLGGFACLYPIARDLIRSHIQTLLKTRTLDVQWSSISGSLTGACLNDVHLKAPRQGATLKSSQVCLQLSPALQWPPLKLNDITLHHPRVFVDLNATFSEHSPRSPGALLKSTSNATEPSSLSLSLLRDVEVYIKSGTLQISAGSIRLAQATLMGSLSAEGGEGRGTISFLARQNIVYPLSWILTPQQLDVKPLSAPWRHTVGPLNVSLARVTLTPKRWALSDVKVRLDRTLHLTGDLQLDLKDSKVRLSNAHMILPIQDDRGAVVPAFLSTSSSAQGDSVAIDHWGGVRVFKLIETLLQRIENEHTISFNQALSMFTPPLSTRDFEHLEREERDWRTALVALTDSQTPSARPSAQHVIAHPQSSLNVRLSSVHLSTLPTSKLALSAPPIKPAQLEVLLTINKALLSDDQLSAELTFPMTLPAQREGSLSLKVRRKGERQLTAKFKDIPISHLFRALSLKSATLTPKLSAIRGMLSGDINFKMSSSIQRRSQHFQLSLSEGYLGIPLLQRPAIGIEGSISGAWRQIPSGWALDHLELTSKNILLKGQADWHDSRSKLTLKLQGARSSCQDAFRLIPRSLLGPIKSARLKGDIRPKISLSYSRPTAEGDASKKEDRFNFKVRGVFKKCTFESLSLRHSPPLKASLKRRPIDLTDVTWLNTPFIFQVDPKLTQGKSVRVGPGTRRYAPLNELPSYVGGAMYLTEEMGFWTGGAISPTLIERALNTNLRERRFVYGGSTVTQQLVKNLFLSRDKQIDRKVQEAIIAGRVIDTVSKQRILELYLNCIEFAPGIYGISSASQYYFQKDPRALSPREAVFLAMLKVAPWRGPNWIKRGRSPNFTWWKQRSVDVFGRLLKRGLISAREAKGAAPFLLTWRKGRYQGASALK